MVLSLFDFFDFYAQRWNVFLNYSPNQSGFNRVVSMRYDISQANNFLR
jgi:hypothetical protein